MTKTEGSSNARIYETATVWPLIVGVGISIVRPAECEVERARIRKLLALYINTVAYPEMPLTVCKTSAFGW